MFRFAHPWAFALILIVLVVILLRWRFDRDSLWPAALRYSDVRLVDAAARTWRVRLRLLPDVLRVLAFVLLVIGLARPQVGDAREVLRGRGLDLVLALDISSSMSALDFQPDNRLSAAKRVIADFIEQRDFDRIGLVVFALEAFYQSPLTLDYDTLLRQLDNIQLVNDVVGVDGNPLLLDGTALGQGILSAGAMLRDSDAPSRVIVLLTDGENNAGIDPITAAEAANLLGIRIYTIGMGKTGEIPIPDEDGSINFIQSELNEDTLRRIAEATGGAYFRAEDAAGLQATYDRIDALERAPVERRVYVPWQDQGWGVLWAALIILLIERLLRVTVFQGAP